jgi:quercetin dioxygenase-like cupin family protein
VPTPIEATEPDPTDIPLNFEIPTTGLRIRYLDVPPGGERPPFVHRTESLDVAIVIEGEMTMSLDDQELVLAKGDVLVQRGTNHAWINRGGEVCRMLFIIIGGKMSPGLMTSLSLDEIVWDPSPRGAGG